MYCGGDIDESDENPVMRPVQNQLHDMEGNDQI